MNSYDYDRFLNYFTLQTGRSRGFAFVEFETVEACKASLTQSEQTIKGKQCEVKPAKTREMGYMVIMGKLVIEKNLNFRTRRYLSEDCLVNFQVYFCLLTLTER